MRRSIRLRHFEYTPEHRDEYDPRFVNRARLSSYVDIANVPPRRARQFIVTLGRRLNAHQPFLTTIWHYRQEKLLAMHISRAGPQGDFSADDFRQLKVYLHDLQQISESHGARALRWSSRIRRSLQPPDFGNNVEHYSLGLINVLAKRKRNFDDELYLAILYPNQAARRIRSAYRKHAVGTLAHITKVAKTAEFFHTLVNTITECVQPQRSRPDRWERRALLALTEKGGLVRHLRVARRLDENKTLDLVDLANTYFRPRADQALGTRFRIARRNRKR